MISPASPGLKPINIPQYKLEEEEFCKLRSGNKLRRIETSYDVETTKKSPGNEIAKATMWKCTLYIISHMMTNLGQPQLCLTQVQLEHSLV